MAWYKTGTATFTNGSPTVTGSGTAWVANTSAGYGVVGPDGRVYEVLSVNSDTGITLSTNYQGTTAAGAAYLMVPTQDLNRVLAAQVTALIADYSTVKNNAGAGKFSDGTPSQPGIAFVADTDTGIRRYATNELSLVGGGADKMIMQGALITDLVPRKITVNNASGIGPEIILNNTGAVIGEEAAVTFSGGGTLRARIRQSLDGAAKGILHFQTGLTTLATQFRITNTDSAVNFVQATGAGTTGRPILSVDGSDTNIDMQLLSKAAGNIVFNTGGGSQFAAIHTASTNRFAFATGSNGGNASIGVIGGGKLAISAEVETSGLLNIRGLNAGVSVGEILGTASNPYVDFNSSGNAVDYDSRIQGTGGSGVAETGNLNAYCNAFFTSGFVVPVADNSKSLGTSTNRWSVVFAATGTINTSDAREKTDIEPLRLGLDFLRELAPVTHRWITGVNDQTMVDSTTEFEDIEQPVKHEVDEPFEEIQVIDGQPRVVVGTRRVARDVVDMLPIIGADGEPVMESHSVPGPLGANGLPGPSTTALRPKLHPVTRMQTVRKPKKVREVTSKPGSRRHAAFIAQDVKAALDARGIDLGMWTLDDASDPDSRQGLRYEQFIPVLTKALVEADDKVQDLEHQLSQLMARVAALENAS